jgi:hypothetical protein
VNPVQINLFFQQGKTLMRTNKNVYCRSELDSLYYKVILLSSIKMKELINNNNINNNNNKNENKKKNLS